MKPRVIVFSAVSLDGRTDGFTPDVGLFYEQIPRWREDATLAGCDTLLHAEDEIPAETEDDLQPPPIASDDTRPLLVVPDSRGRLRTWHYWRQQPYWRDVMAVCSTRTPREYLDYLERRAVPYIVAGEDHVDYGRALEILGAEHGVSTVRVDSGGTLNGCLLGQGLVDDIALLIHPALVGGTTPRSVFRGTDLTSAQGVVSLALTDIERMRDGIVLMTYAVTT